MAAFCFWGEPGSYKTSSAVWFEMLPALRDGRIVVTNIQGLKDKAGIEKTLNEKFPDSADIIRINTDYAEPLAVLRRWFHWLPIGSLLILDEVQNIYPNDRTFKADDEKYDLLPISEYEKVLPPKVIQTYQSQLEKYRCKDDKEMEETRDDLGYGLYDENGYARYPQNFKESFMKHRHYNWDIILCTPDIRQLNKDVRGVLQTAFHHRSKDSVGKFIPYYKRRPRVLSHPPQTNGGVANGKDQTSFPKIPKTVFRLYKSTRTGQHTQKVERNMFGARFIFMLSLAVLAICYVSYFTYTKFISPDEIPSSDNLEADTKTSENNLQVVKNNNSDNGSNDSEQIYYDESIPLDLPYNAEKIYFNGYQTIYENKIAVDRDYFFTLKQDETEFSISSDDLKIFGITAKLINECLVVLISDDKKVLIPCQPNEIQKPVEEDKTDKPKIPDNLSIL
mgnify:CR=1 FL=1